MHPYNVSKPARFNIRQKWFGKTEQCQKWEAALQYE